MVTKVYQQGEPYDEGYFIEHDRDLDDDECLRYETVTASPDFDRAAALFLESRDILLGLGNRRRALGMTLHNLGEVTLHRARPDEAAALFESGAEYLDAVGDRYSQAHCLIGLGHALHAQGDLASAADAWMQAYSILQPIDARKAAGVATLLEGTTSHALGSAPIQS